MDVISNSLSKKARVVFLDGWRGVAISLVLISHFIDIPNMNEGRLGVDIFFVLSGMLMSHILFVKKIPIALFYKRRISRIIPVFFLFVLTVYLVAKIVGWEHSNLEIISTLLFLRTYVPAEVDIWANEIPTKHIWSLNVEEHAYVLMSILAFWVNNRRLQALILLSVGFCSIITALSYHFKLVDVNNYLVRTESAISFIFLSAGYYLVKDLVWSRISWVVGEEFSGSIRRLMSPLLFVLAFVLYSYELGNSLSKMLTISIAPIFLAVSVNHLEDTYQWIKSLLCSRVLVLLGTWSYSIYLWQQPLYEYNHVLGPYVSLVCALVIGIMSYYFFERPVRQWLNKNW